MKPSISTITAVYNGAETIASCLESVAKQTYPCEHIIVDGKSKDSTLAVVSRFSHVKHVISEPDRGIYDAMNKGIALSSGDVVGLLNADDFYTDEHVFEQIADVFARAPVDAVFADMVYVRPENLQRVVRYYRGADFTLRKLAFGWMPPHPTLFVRRDCYERFGFFKTDYRIAADFELVARFFVKHRIRYEYLPATLVTMRTGGVSTRSWNSNVILNREIMRACRENGIATNMLKIYSKYLAKSLQLLSRP